MTSSIKPEDLEVYYRKEECGDPVAGFGNIRHTKRRMQYIRIELKDEKLSGVSLAADFIFLAGTGNFPNFPKNAIATYRCPVCDEERKYEFTSVDKYILYKGESE